MRRVFKGKNFCFILVLIGLFLSFHGFYITFFCGLHNLDMAQNLIFIRDDLKVQSANHGITLHADYFDKALDGKLITLEDSYFQGVRNLVYGIQFLISGIFLTGFSLGLIYKGYQGDTGE